MSILGNDPRLKKDAGDSREPRTMQDRPTTENREANDEERLEAFRNSLFANQLPDIPQIPGYHVCWLTTQNPRDPIHGRMRLGYEPIKAKDIPGFDQLSLGTGEYAGCIGVNEMIAFKIPLRLYTKYMQHAFHDEPAAEQRKISQSHLEAREAMREQGGELIIEEGSAELAKVPSAPDFTRLYGER